MLGQQPALSPPTPHACAPLGLQDGYRVARPEYFGDVAPEPGSEAAAALREASDEVERLADAWAERLRRLSQVRGRAGGKQGQSLLVARSA